MASKQAIADFLGQKRIAMVGVSRNSQEFANTIYRLFQEKGYLVTPVNPKAEQVEGVPCYASVTALPEPVDGVLVMLPPARAAAVVRECAAAGIARVWLLKRSDEAAGIARQAGMTVVNGACPHMFLGGGFPHNIHRFFTRLEA